MRWSGVIKNTISILFLCASALESASIKKGGIEECKRVPPQVLATVLGSAFNPRYMSISRPKLPERYSNEKNLKRTAQFYVDGDWQENELVSDEIPAWQTNFALKSLEMTTTVFLEDDAFAVEEREKRAIAKAGPQWKCTSEIKWIDLGRDYFPRFLRSVECPSQSCWFGRYKCRPRSFTVHLLKKRNDRCDSSKVGYRNRIEGLPEELRELWIWEEKAVNFCCDCTL